VGNRNDQLTEGHPLACSRRGCNTRRRVVTPVPLCLRHLAQLRRAKQITEVGDDLLLPVEYLDGEEIVDEIAVETLSHGWRVVRATWTERSIAASYIMEHYPEAVVPTVAERLGISSEAAYQLTETIRSAGNTPPLSLVNPDVSTTNPQEGTE
jgi:hypothetical protein